MKSVNCDVIQDLLPSYLDKISSESTNKLIEEHLQSCENCQEALQSMSKDMDGKIIENQDEQIDFLKGYRKNKIRSVIFAVALTIIIILLVGIIGTYLFIKFEDTRYNIDLNDVNVEYMYIDEYLGRKRLNIYLYSNKYSELESRPYWREENSLSSIQINNFGIYKVDDNNELSKNVYFALYTKHIISNIFLGKRNTYGGTYCNWMLDDSVDKLYITDQFGDKNAKEIWNKDTKVMTEEEWKEWYLKEYVPDEVIQLYNNDLTDARIYDTSTWRHKYQPKINL